MIVQKLREPQPMADQREIDRKAKRRVAIGVAIELALVTVGVSMAQDFQHDLRR